MIEIKAPDGATIRFPTGTDDATIERVMREAYPVQKSSSPANSGGGIMATLAAAPGKFLSAADDMARIVANAATFGQADKFAGYMSGTGTDAEKKLTELARQRAGTAAIAGDVLGSLAPAGMIAGAGRAAGAATGLGKYIAPVAGSAALGGAMGAADAGLNDRDALTGAAIGAGAGVVGHGIGKAIAAGANKLLGKAPAIMSPDALKAAKNSAYDAVKNTGVEYSPAAYQRFTADLNKTLQGLDISPERHPRAWSILQKIKQQQAPGMVYPVTGFDQLRQVIRRDLMKSNDGAERMFGQTMIGKIDDFIGNAGQRDVTQGVASRASDALTNARNLNTRYMKDKEIAQAVESANLRAASTGSGGNVDNAIRQNLRRVLEKSQGLTPDEKAAFKTAIEGGKGQNLLRLAGKLSPSGNGLMAALGVGGAMINPGIGALALGGIGAKAVADRTTVKNVESLAKLVRSGGNKSAITASKAISDEQRDALIRALIGGGVVSAPRILGQ